MVNYFLVYKIIFEPTLLYDVLYLLQRKKLCILESQFFSKMLSFSLGECVFFGCLVQKENILCVLVVQCAVWMVQCVTLVMK